MATRTNPGTWRARTCEVRAGQARTPFQETSEALFLTTGFAYDAPEEAEARFAEDAPGYSYTRYGNPTVAMFEERLAALEGAEAALSTASGMAAVSAVLMAALSQGDHVVAAKALFGASRSIITTILPRFGIDHTLVEGEDAEAWRAAVTPRTKLFLCETPTNPMLSLCDIPAIAAIANDAGAILVVDNAFATPALQTPLKLGAHVVVHSTTKYIDGQGRTMGGMVLCDRAFLLDHLRPFVRSTGPVISPFSAWVCLKGLETLSLRMKAHSDNAAHVAAFLASHPKVSKTFYPFAADHPQIALAKAQMSDGGGMVSFAVGGGKPAAFRLLQALQLIDICNNLGDAKSLITHPATTTHQRLSADERAELGITDGVMRLSVGLEDPADLCDDLAQALEAV